MKKEQPNEVWALHLNGKILTGNVWKEYSSKYGDNGLQGWKPPKRLYFTRGHASAGRSHLPQQIKDKVKIVRYLPEETE